MTWTVSLGSTATGTTARTPQPSSASSVTRSTGVTEIVCDASVVLKWALSEGESEVAEARALRTAAASGRLEIAVLDLTYYEVANILIRSRTWSSADVTRALELFERLCGPGVPLTARSRGRATNLASAHGLTFYDAAYWAVAAELGATLVTADRELLDAGAGESPTAAAARLGLELES